MGPISGWLSSTFTQAYSWWIFAVNEGGSCGHSPHVPHVRFDRSSAPSSASAAA